MRNPFKRTVPTDGIILRRLGTAWPNVHNNTADTVRITFEVAGLPGELRSVDIGPREIAPFHVSDGKFRADFIEIIQKEN